MSINEGGVRLTDSHKDENAGIQDHAEKGSRSFSRLNSISCVAFLHIVVEQFSF